MAVDLGPNSHIHVIGIGGAGMSAIARLLLESGVNVSGSDRQANDITRALQHDGATIFEGHQGTNLVGADAVFVSSAIKDDNPEIVAAKAAGIPILTRREFFRYLLPNKSQIAVAGTHGKTTTTALIIHLLSAIGRDPSYIIGGTLISTGGNAHVGKGKEFVIEADEYGGMFLGLTPKIAVVTNIEHDHPDIFPTLDSVLDSFRQFIALLPDDGVLIACADDPNALRLATERKSSGKPTLTYGIDHPLADYVAVPDGSTEQTTSFRVRWYDHEAPRRAVSSLAGRHNVLNALGALAAIHSCNVSLESVIPALATFQGTGRRFELMGEANGVRVLSDYGHHPTAIRATLQAAHQRYPQARIWAVWQPHTYSRTRLLADDFARAFSDADHALITEIYAARENPSPGDPTGTDMAHRAASAGHADVRFSGDLDSTTALLKRDVRPGDVVIIFSAGDAPKIGENLLRGLR